MAWDSHPPAGSVSCCSLLPLREVSVQCGWGQMRVWCQVRSQGKMMRWILFHMWAAAQAVDCVGVGGGVAGGGVGEMMGVIFFDVGGASGGGVWGGGGGGGGIGTEGGRLSMSSSS